MTFEDLFEVQNRQQIAVYGIDPADQDMEYLRSMFLAVQVELVEALNEVGWKPWKKRGAGEIRTTAVAYELADVMIFLTNIALACGVTAEHLEREIWDKLKENKRRQEQGY